MAASNTGFQGLDQFVIGIGERVFQMLDHAFHREQAGRLKIGQETVAKGKKRAAVTDLPTVPKNPSSTVLMIQEEAVIVAFRQYALRPTIPTLTRTSLHLCLQLHRISCLPEVEGETPAETEFKSYPIGHFHIDIAEVRTAEGCICLSALTAPAATLT